MQLPELSIRRPVFATVLSLLIVLVGVVSFNRLVIREYPKIDNPTVTVETRYVGASSAVMESQVTKVLEDSLSGVEGLDVISSISRQEQSQITVKFLLTRDPDAAAADVRDKVSRVRQRLPTGIDEPVISKVEADAFPVIWISFSSDTLNTLQLSDLANRLAKPMMQTAPGVADVRVFGERKYAMRIWLDTDRLASYKLTPQDVEDALRRANVEVPAGRVESQAREFNVTTATDLRTTTEFEDIVVRTVNGMPVRIGDVARIEQGPLAERFSVRYNSNESIALGVLRNATANPLELSKAIKAKLPIKATGMVIRGMMDVRKVRKKMKITKDTSAAASKMVWNTASMDFSMNTEESLATSMRTPGGRFSWMRGIMAVIALLSSKGLAVALRKTPSAMASLLL